MPYAKNVTMLNELPELSDVEQNIGVGNYAQHSQHSQPGQPHPTEYDAKYQKIIRQSQQIMPEAGMSLYGRPSMESYEQMNAHQPQPIYIPRDPTCLEIANHVKECPICSKFYNNDKTIYIILIVILAIISLLLLKKVLDV